MSPIIWAVLLMSVGLGLAMLEVFIPSAGILGFLSVAAIITAIVLAFSSGGATIGFLFLGVAAVSLPTAIILAFKWLPNTPIGRRLMLGKPKEREILPQEDPRETYQALIGSTGIAKSAMLPGGAIMIDGKVYEAVCESGSLEPGERITVVRIRNNRLVIRKTAEGTPVEDSEQDPLARPIDSLGIDPFDDPLS